MSSAGECTENGESVTEQELELGDVVETLADGIVLLDADWRIYYANQTARRLSRILPEHLNSRTLWELYPDMIGSEIEQLYREAITTGEDRHVERFYYAPFDLWLNLLAHPTRRGLMLHYRDVTALKKAEDAARSSDEMADLALAAGDGVGRWNWDIRENLVYTDEKFASLYGIQPEHAVAGASIEQFLRKVHPDDLARVQQLISEAVRMGGEYEAEYRLVQEDGSVRWVSTRGRCRLDEHGEAFTFPGVAFETTGLRRAEAAQRESERYLRLLLDSTPSAFYAIDEEGATTLCNKAFLNMLGFADESDVLGQKLHEVIHHSHPDGQPYLEKDCMIYRAAKTGEPAYVQDEVFYRKDGSQFPVEYWAHPIVRGDRLRGAITTFIDVTDRKRTESALIQSEKLAAVGRLASSIAHEINNPLEAVTNLIYLARHTSQTAEMQRYLDQVDAELRRVSAITSQTLRFHKQATKPRAISCADLFTTVLSLYEGRLRNSQIEVTKRKRSRQPVEVYEGDIRQVLSNLVGNAIDAMPQGGYLHLRGAESRNWSTGRRGLVLTVADTGEGMDPATRAHIFEAFFTTKGIGGTGLGLWVSSEIVQRHEGRMQVRSSQRPQHHGTVVRLFLPLGGITANVT